MALVNGSVKDLDLTNMGMGSNESRKMVDIVI